MMTSLKAVLRRLVPDITHRETVIEEMILTLNIGEYKLPCNYALVRIQPIRFGFLHVGAPTTLRRLSTEWSPALHHDPATLTVWGETYDEVYNSLSEEVMTFTRAQPGFRDVP